jgi:hypothetical protein
MRLHIVLSIFFLSYLALSRAEEAAAAEDATVETEAEAEAELVCHANCETCTGPGADECSSCKAGYKEEKSGEGDDAKMSCVDINECVEESGICPVGKYCANTDGSYSCEGCHPVCSKCYGPSRTHCFECIPGSIMRQPFTCSDIDECASGAMCMGMYEVCVNTPGHYKCECARFFKRDEATGQCQPDPAIYSQYLPPSARRAAEAKKEEEKKEETQDAEATEEKKEEL